MDEKLFNPTALKKIRTPEKLDAMLKITTPVGWMGLTTMLVILLSVVIWSIFGSFTEKAEGMGMILDVSGIGVVSAPAGGKVTQVFTYEGAHVTKGSLLAMIKQPSAMANTNMARFDVNLSSNDREAMSRVSQFDAKKHQQQAFEEVYSDYDGIVTELDIYQGMTVTDGATICRIRLDGGRKDMSGYFYVPVDNGKRIEPGMTLSLAPNSADIKQSGSLVGVVRYVGEYPVGVEAIRTTLGNNHLADWFLQKSQSALVEVSFDLVRDENSPSGYLWTTNVGEHKKITPGSFCTGYVIIDRKPPIEKIFYKFSQWLRSR